MSLKQLKVHRRHQNRQSHQVQVHRVHQAHQALKIQLHQLRHLIQERSTQQQNPHQQRIKKAVSTDRNKNHPSHCLKGWFFIFIKG